ncbi:hypothetical protein [Paraclostridium bifermentans]|uniref:hypothetical protein n=1 Tax=Paraclostridium bifermentans TaxID=1490 RepID=UPI00189DE039|nr:hypothetical protein [Paraclostridium bifermentans]
MHKLQSIHEKYKKYKKDEEEIKGIYKTIKEEYLKDKKLDVTLEKIYLEKKLENYTGETVEFYKTMFIAIMTTILTLVVERAISDSDNILFSIIMLVVLILVFILWRVKKDKNIKREINEYNYYKICLKVLDDLESNI